MENKPKLIRSDIISCSRRTDIPAFMMDWVLQRIKDGYVDVTNPFNKNQISRISLKPEDVKCWVWWSKDFSNWIKMYIKNKNLFNSYKGHSFQFTINSPSELQRNIKSSLEERFEQLKWLINKFGLLSINFRYDPIILYKRKKEKRIRSNLNRFKYIIENVAELGIKDVIFSFATVYSKVERRMKKRGFIPVDPKFSTKKRIISEILAITKKNGLNLKACCQPDLLEIEGITQSHCIDAIRLEKVIKSQFPLRREKDTGQRQHCGCYKSRDIGGYNGIFRCKHNCTYCYANPRKS
jgi:hypothetical protein